MGLEWKYEDGNWCAESLNGAFGITVESDGRFTVFETPDKTFPNKSFFYLVAAQKWCQKREAELAAKQQESPRMPNALEEIAVLQDANRTLRAELNRMESLKLNACVARDNLKVEAKQFREERDAALAEVARLKSELAKADSISAALEIARQHSGWEASRAEVQRLESLAEKPSLGKLKGLEWTHDKLVKAAYCKTVVGTYWVQPINDVFKWCVDEPGPPRDGDLEPCESIEAGKAACQLDYEKRVAELFEAHP